VVGEIRLYVEGHKALRRGFLSVLSSIREAARERRIRFEVIASGGRPIAEFMKGMRTHGTALNILLKDAEGPDDGTLFSSVRDHSDWKPPEGVTVSDEQLHFMVQVMEAWFLADREALRAYYGDGLRENQLPANPKVEDVSKQDVLEGLKKATEKTQKGAYHKTRHAPDLLREVNVSLVRAAAPACERVFATLIAGILGV
jgi:hypothetical protein